MTKKISSEQVLSDSPVGATVVAQFRLRIKYGDEIAIGPGKIAILEAIAETVDVTMRWGKVLVALADVAPQQVDALRWADAHGAVALLVVRLGGAVWCVPARCLWGDGPRTWTAAHLDARGTRLRGVDWLGCV